MTEKNVWHIIGESSEPLEIPQYTTPQVHFLLKFLYRWHAKTNHDQKEDLKQGMENWKSFTEQVKRQELRSTVESILRVPAGQRSTDEIEKIRKYFLHIHLFDKSLKQAKQQQICQTVSLKIFQKDDIITLQGELVSELCVIFKGRVRVLQLHYKEGEQWLTRDWVKKQAEERSLVKIDPLLGRILKTLTEGGVVGDDALCSSTSRSNVSVVVLSSEAQVLVLGRKSFDDCLQDLFSAKQQKALQLQYLVQHKVFELNPNTEAERLRQQAFADELIYQKISKKGFLVRYDTPVEKVYFIVEGQLTLTARFHDHDKKIPLRGLTEVNIEEACEVEVSQVGSGTILGMMECMEGLDKWQLSAKTFSSEVVVFHVPAQTFIENLPIFKKSTVRQWKALTAQQMEFDKARAEALHKMAHQRTTASIGRRSCAQPYPFNTPHIAQSDFEYLLSHIDEVQKQSVADAGETSRTMGKRLSVFSDSNSFDQRSTCSADSFLSRRRSSVLTDGFNGKGRRTTLKNSSMTDADELMSNGGISNNTEFPYIFALKSEQQRRLSAFLQASKRTCPSHKAKFSNLQYAESDDKENETAKEFNTTEQGFPSKLIRKSKPIIVADFIQSGSNGSTFSQQQRMPCRAQTSPISLLEKGSSAPDEFAMPPPIILKSRSNIKLCSTKLHVPASTNGNTLNKLAVSSVQGLQTARKADMPKLEFTLPKNGTSISYNPSKTFRPNTHSMQSSLLSSSLPMVNSVSTLESVLQPFENKISFQINLCPPISPVITQSDSGTESFYVSTNKINSDNDQGIIQLTHSLSAPTLMSKPYVQDAISENNSLKSSAPYSGSTVSLNQPNYNRNNRNAFSNDKIEPPALKQSKTARQKTKNRKRFDPESSLSILHC